MSSDTGPPLDYSFKSLLALEDIKQEQPRRGVKKYKMTADGKYISSSLRLNNNQITTIVGIPAAVGELLESPDNLTWLDLSFNKLVSVSPELTQLKNLKILYLHGNCLSDLPAFIHIMKPMDHVISLTLHGNPLAERKNYKTKILLAMTSLKSLDFNNITPADRKKLNDSLKHK